MRQSLVLLGSVVSIHFAVLGCGDGGTETPAPPNDAQPGADAEPGDGAIDASADASSADSGNGLDAGPVTNDGGDGGHSDAGDSDSDSGNGAGPALVWPNETSHTNSDSWLVQHHDELTELRPRVLLINFVPGRGEQEVRAAAQGNAYALAEGSKYHGYSSPDAPAFLNYQIVHFVDLAGQATRSGDGFGYGEFMTGQTFADKVKLKAPNGTKNLTVCEMFEQGVINEAWVAEKSDDSAKLFEMKARGQVYNADLSKKAGQFDTCSGNGCLSGFSCGVSVRLGEINLDRGPGCATHAYGHGIEGQVNRNQIPYFTDNAKRFFNFGMDKRFGTPFESFYMCPYDTTSCIVYVSPSHVKNGSTADGKVFDFEGYGTGCGNVHFASHSRGQYDYEGPSAGVTARATCEGYGLGAAGGQDATANISYDTYKALNQDKKLSDCGGGWQIYMRQSFPGYQNKAKGVDGKPMKNWWPFLFY